MLRFRAAGQVVERIRPQESEGLAGWVLARLHTFRGSRNIEQRQMRLMETLSLGGKRELMLVECGSERYLVGGSLESVQTIVSICGRAASGGLKENEDCW